MSVILYHLPTCPQCRVVEQMLKKNNIEFESCTDVSKMLAIGISHTPTLEVDGERMTGKTTFDWIRGQANHG